MSKPLLDLTDPAVRWMIKIIKRRGYVTRKELNEVLPLDEFSPEQIEEVVSQIAQMGIPIVEGGEET